MVVTHSAHGMCRARYHRAAAFRDSGGLRLGKSAHCERPEHMGERSVRVGSVQRHMLQSSSTTVGAAWSVWESGRWENAPSAAASESPLQQFGSLQEPSPRVLAQNSLELSESAARRRLGAQHGVGARPESVRPPRRRPPATRRQRQLTADADAVGHARERTFQEALENVSVAYFPMLFFGRSAASPYSLAETASRPRPPSAVRPPPGPSGAALPRLFQTANRRRKARLCARGSLK